MKIVKSVLEDNFWHMYCSDFSDFWKFVLHGSVATQLKRGGIFNYTVSQKTSHFVIFHFFAKY